MNILNNKYSQYNEEIFLKDFFVNKKNGFLVDIGAADGIRYSNSRLLIESGWSGLLIEPNYKNFKKLVSLYNNNNNNNNNNSNNNIYLENLGCSNENIENANFFIDQNDEYEQLSTFNINQMETCKNIYNCQFIKNKINIIKTSDIFFKYKISKIDFLSIDTESFDTNVVLGIDFDSVDINLICVEHFTDKMNNYLKNFGYNICHKTTGNIFMSKII